MYVKETNNAAAADIQPRTAREVGLMRFGWLADWYFAFGQAFCEVINVVQVGFCDF